MLLVLLGVAVATGLVFLWRRLNNINKYWEERGIPHDKPVPIFGNNFRSFIRQISVVEAHEILYKRYYHTKFYGVYDFMRPTLVVKDMELVERILIKDFHHFVDRGVAEFADNSDPIQVNLFNMCGRKWKAMRNKFTPMFTTGKLRQMVPQIKDLSELLVTVFEKNQTDVDLRDMFQRFSMDVIASCAFGMDVKTIQESEESEFRKKGKMVFKFTPLQILRTLLFMTLPKVAKLLGVTAGTDPEVTSYFAKILKETLAQRKSTDLTRNDFVQLMVTLQKQGSIEFEGDETDDYLKMESEEKTEKHLENFELTDDVMVGQAFVFLAAGFEAGANALMWLFYELAKNPDAQETVREEITNVLKARGGVLNYDSLREMTYLNQCVQEALRMHSFLPVLFRICTKEYTFPGTSFTIKPGQMIFIPICGIHNDPEIYPEPEKFKPERFDPDIKTPNCAYLPFGDGPRICIAMRFAMTEIKLCAARLLKDYAFKLSPKTSLPIVLDRSTFAAAPKDPLYFNLTKIHTTEALTNQ